MAFGPIGVTCMAADAKQTVANIKKAEDLGIKNAWLTGGGLATETMAVFAAAAAVTNSVRMGTCIIQTWPRHPFTLVAQTLSIESLAPGRFVLGVGPSHKPTMHGTWGFDFKRPLSHLREYLTILNLALKDGSGEFVGEQYQVHATPWSNPPKTPVMISALREASFRLAGELTDGAITWVCPVEYVKRSSFAAIEAGAKAAGRATPPIVFHAPICVHENADEVREVARQQLANYTRLPFYIHMFEQAGFEEAASGWSDRMVDAVVLHGTEDVVAKKLEALYAAGVGEVIAMPLGAGANRAAVVDRGWNLLASLSK